MRGVSRRFGSVQALHGADFACAAGEIHALLGENGAGKSTLMHILFGLLRADTGETWVAGRPARFASPREAMAAGLGMVHQHFTQVAAMSVAENVWLGRQGVRYREADARRAVQAVGASTGLALDPDARVGDLPVGLRQRLEIVKALAREVGVLILDEPPAVLAPREAEALFVARRQLAANGVAVVLITHKLREVAAIADRVTVLRRGATVFTGPRDGIDLTEIARAMVGGSDDPALLREVHESSLADRAPARRDPVLQVRGLVVRRPDQLRLAVRGASFEVGAEEIVGIAAVEGNGQCELLRAVAGLLPHEGSVALVGGGLAGFVPEDRQYDGLLLDFSVAENLMLGARLPLLVDRTKWAADAETAIRAFDVRAATPERLVRQLSGGNQQKLVLARELGRRPALLVAENPTRGLDVHAAAAVHQKLLAAAGGQGSGVLFHSTDLDEVLALSDRVAVMLDGEWREVPPAGRTRESVGALIVGAS